MAAILGSDRRHLQTFSWEIASYEEVVLAAWDELDAYIEDLVAARRQRLTDDLISRLIVAEDLGDRLNAEELRSLVAILLMAGSDTTRRQLAASVQALCDHPDQWALLASVLNLQQMQSKRRCAIRRSYFLPSVQLWRMSKLPAP